MASSGGEQISLQVRTLATGNHNVQVPAQVSLMHDQNTGKCAEVQCTSAWLTVVRATVPAPPTGRANQPALLQMQ